MLLVDDQALLRATFRLLLDAEEDIEVVGEAATGAQAVDLAKAHLILMDIRMPDMDGIEATRRITADDDLAGVRVLILTTFETDDLVVAALRAGASGYLGKGADPGTLLDAIRRQRRPPRAPGPRYRPRPARHAGTRGGSRRYAERRHAPRRPVRRRGRPAAARPIVS